MAIVFGIAPERMNIGIHQTAVVQTHRIYAVADVCHAHSSEGLEQALVVLRGADPGGDEIGSGAKPGGFPRAVGCQDFRVCQAVGEQASVMREVALRVLEFKGGQFGS
jgi:hypothetical protein